MPLRTPDLNWLIQWAQLGRHKSDVVNREVLPWWQQTYPGVFNYMNEKLYQYLLADYVPVPPGPPPPDASYRAAVLADAPVGYWTLDDANGLVAVDASPTGNPAAYAADVSGYTPRVPTPMAGGWAVTFDEVLDRRITIPLHAAYASQNTGEFSVECWFKIPAPPTIEADYLLDIRGGTAFVCVVTVTPAGTLRVHRRDGVALEALIDVPDVLDATWHHLVVTATAGVFSVYIEGALVQALPDVPPPLAATDTICLGGNGRGAIQFLKGMLDEVAFYPAALSAARVLAHFLARQ